MLTPEGKIQQKIGQYLKKEGWLTVKLMQTSLNGMPDILALKGGRHIYIEVKTPQGRVSQIQDFRIHELRGHGATVFISHSLDELKEQLYEQAVQAVNPNNTGLRNAAKGS